MCLKYCGIAANSVDPDQMPCSAVSELGLHCKGLSVPKLRVITIRCPNILVKYGSDDLAFYVSFNIVLT